jgi:hypothetical protein
VDLGHDYVRFTSTELLGLADGLERHAQALRDFAEDVARLRTAVAAATRPAGMPASLPWPPVDDEDGES